MKEQGIIFPLLNDLQNRTYVLYYTCKSNPRTLTKEFFHSNSHPALSKNNGNSGNNGKTPIECRPDSAACPGALSSRVESGSFQM